ncbi:ATP-binding cassette domain-containing protein [Geobacter sulfurreducens]|jgi:ATPase subunit of ABC transporter with duplicated ATPase domains|uniref:Probable ATP-binding protein YbiT n=1 Tax=Geobacter sulfurreducens (strain ATCC 51573 / DSM 12127 / PCA) TaxID=243231 RepID=Q74GS6_GEOSL|nr:ATP-binding cassette domain-containing protein [Geobacter sulfurreducens]AAR33504.1 ABC transporter, ATP-binding protein [Geobacter sulfurreducens PCA]ADI83006.1 ABC transporter, ATP-binding protein [Geobacter sulfurreducens KN400]AJY69905.1 ABC transporter ATP-binding protein [Geobacter sulfurreducens]UAC04269.1 ATP-binding cassette domain-containing protein [Geobacter sulfurreducens]HCD96981.1 ABC transporter ATP-binding protein [Geobacter sulfurreducens]
MISTSNISLAYGKRVIFKDVNIKFVPGNCYGLIGANGAGKSTFLKILAGLSEPDSGTVSVGPRERISFLKQDQFAFDEHTVFNTVIMGNPRLYEVMHEREAIYAKAEFSEEDGIRSAELEAEFAEMDGYEAESEAAVLLNGLGIPEELRHKQMKELEGGEKVRVLLAQALFGNPDVLLLDEPTNHLDLKTITWLEDFLARFNNTVIVVSHDRHFLNQICTHVADIDFGRIQVYVGNYDFWYQASQLTLKQKQDESRKIADKAAELKEFIQRFSSNASKAKQATSRKKLLEKLTVEEMPVSSRKYPYVVFKPERPCGDVILEISGLSKEIDGVQVFKDLDLIVGKGDKIAFVGANSLAKTTLFQILAGELEPDAGSFRWGVTITSAYFPKENGSYFDNDLNLIEWLGQFAPPTEGESFARGFLGRMLFSGDEATKKASVLSGGERVRCMLARMMLLGANALVLDEPTNHLDLESITALNNGLIAFSEVVLFSSHDHEFVNTLANRIVEFTPGGIIDRKMTFDDYLESAEVAEERDRLCQGHCDLTL